MPSKVAVTDTYKEMERFISKIAAHARRTYNLEMDDVISAVNYAFMQAFLTYDPKVGEFSTWVGDKAKHRIEDLLRSRGRQSAKNKLFEPVDPDEVPARQRFDVNDWLEGLERDARLVAGLAVRPPMDVKATLVQLGDTPANWRYAIRDFLRDLEWPEKRIAEAFREVRRSL